MNNCCRLGSAPYDDGRVLLETDNFFIFPALGPIGIEGYLLIASKEHYLGTGEMPEEFQQELSELVVMTKSKLYEVYRKKSVMFEHGPRVGRCGWGGCVDHLHLHVIPGVDITHEFAVSLVDHLEEESLFYRVDRTEGFKRTQDIFERYESSYVMLQTPDDKRLVAEVNFPGPRQWLRRLTAKHIGSSRWNWREYPDRETVSLTLDKLHDVFNR